MTPEVLKPGTDGLTFRIATPEELLAHYRVVMGQDPGEDHACGLWWTGEEDVIWLARQQFTHPDANLFATVVHELLHELNPDITEEDRIHDKTGKVLGPTQDSRSACPAP